MTTPFLTWHPFGNREQATQRSPLRELEVGVTDPGTGAAAWRVTEPCPAGFRVVGQDTAANVNAAKLAAEKAAREAA